MTDLESIGELVYEFPLKDLPKHKRKKSRIKLENGVAVKTMTTEMRRLKNTPYCSICGLRGDTWSIRKFSQKNQDDYYRLHLYGHQVVTGIKVRLLADYKKPKSYGGKTKINNMVTLCEICYKERHNQIKIVEKFWNTL